VNDSEKTGLRHKGFGSKKLRKRGIICIFRQKESYMLRIENLTKTYSGGITAVRNLSLSVDSGDIFGFIGHNGAGKTTTIKATVGILPFEQGEITIDGHSVRKDPVACKSLLAYLPDDPQLYDALTGIQYVNFIADVFRVSAQDRKARVTKYAEMFEIESSLNTPISSYSHGMKQKIALISAFIHTPRLLVLDEPFIGLDPKASFTVKTIMKEFCAEGNAIFFSTHILEVAEKLCTKVAIIKNGELLACGDTNKVIGEQSLESVFLELTENE
jgi:ABC-2 type transport system ATP-binding protein